VPFRGNCAAAGVNRVGGGFAKHIGALLSFVDFTAFVVCGLQRAARE
jgi:hypothetical protein